MNDLTSYSPENKDESTQKLQKARATFFKNVVAERYPDLLIDLCDYWINQNYYKVPTKSEESQSTF